MFSIVSSSIDDAKIGAKIGEQADALVLNILASLEGRPLKSYKKGMMGNLTGPMLVALGHGHPQGYGLGPNCPGCVGFMCWFCCCIGGPCSPPAGSGAAKAKSDFNKSVKPQIGKGLDK